MVNVINAVGAANAALGGLNLAAVAQLRAIVDASVDAPPSLRREIWVQAVGAVGYVGKGSEAFPAVGLDGAVALVGQLAADADPVADAVPYVVTLLPGVYTAPSKPFERPVVLRLLDGATFSAASGPIPASLPARTAASAFPALFGIIQDGVGPTVARPFALVVGAGAYLPTLIYDGRGMTGTGQGGMTFGDVPASTGPTAAPLLMSGCVCGDVEASGNLVMADSTVVGTVDAPSAAFYGCQLGGDVTTTVGGIVARNTLLPNTVTTPALTLVQLDDVSASRVQQGNTTVVGGTVSLASRAAFAVQADSQPHAASPITITFPTPFRGPPRSVVVTPFGTADATTVYRVTAVTATNFTLAHAGTAPTSWNWVAVQ